jgi:predicted nucleic acid-binding protein
MSLLLDTNILTRSAQPAHPMQKTALNAVSILKTRGKDLCIVPQNLVEFWAVATRPLNVNGLEMTTSYAQAELARLKSFFRFLPDNSIVHEEWEKLVGHHAVSGKSTYDTRLVAAMKVHGIGELLTFNSADFKRYPGITVISPESVL